jgi:nucleotide-binding universal stress UspA family protein
LSANNLRYGGGIDGIGVTTGAEQVYLVFYGSQWGTQGTDADGNVTLSGDPSGEATHTTGGGAGAAVAALLLRTVGRSNCWVGAVRRPHSFRCSTSSAHGRVVVVRGHWQRVAGHIAAPIVVGTEGSAPSVAAVEFAFEEAALRGTSLVAVCALADAPGVLGGSGQIRRDFEDLITRAEKGHPGVTVCRQIAEGSARSALLAAAFEAQMLVVGARGLGGVRGMMLGSVSHTLLQHAPCPVGVARVTLSPGPGGPTGSGRPERMHRTCALSPRYLPVGNLEV